MLFIGVGLFSSLYCWLHFHKVVSNAGVSVFALSVELVSSWLLPLLLLSRFSRVRLCATP